MKKKHVSSIRYTQQAKALLEELSEKLGISQSAVIEIAIRRLAEKENVMGKKIPLSHSRFATVDDEDHELVMQRKWSADWERPERVDGENRGGEDAANNKSTRRGTGRQKD